MFGNDLQRAGLMPHKENGHHFSFVDHSCQLCEIEHHIYLSQGKPVCSEAASPAVGVARSALADTAPSADASQEHKTCLLGMTIRAVSFAALHEQG